MTSIIANFTNQSVNGSVGVGPGGGAGSFLEPIPLLPLFLLMFIIIDIAAITGRLFLTSHRK